MNIAPAARPLVVAGLVVALAVAVIGADYPSVGLTADERVHVDAGLEWLEDGDSLYAISPENPPLARVAVALGPYLSGIRLHAPGHATSEALDSDDPGPLIFARLGVLPFFVAACALVFAIARRLHDGAVAAAATLAFVSVPSVLAHAGLATTDVPLVCTFLLVAWSLLRWRERPTTLAGAVVGACLGLMLLTKFSGLVFLPGLAALVFLSPRAAASRVRWTGVWLGFVVLLVVVWGGYRFRLGSIEDKNPDRARISHIVDTCPITAEGGWLRSLVENHVRTTIPAPELVVGVLDLCAHNAAGHRAYLLGSISMTGFRAYYPVALAAKTPLPLLAFALVGAGWAWRQRRSRRPALAPLAAAVLILAGGVLSRINIGVRHVLVIYPLLSILAAHGAIELWRRRARLPRAIVIIIVAAGVAAELLAVGLSRPHLLSYFNVAFAQRRDDVLLDSDLDWGQDIPGLQRAARERQIDRLSIAYFGTANLCRHALPRLVWLRPHTPTTGWIAVSEMYHHGITQGSFPDDDLCDPARYDWDATGEDGYTWLDAYTPVEIIGGSIRLYHLPEDH